jgi:hypothetical protein
VALLAHKARSDAVDEVVFGAMERRFEWEEVGATLSLLSYF